MNGEHGELPLSGRVAVVAGATRGAGRGIARGLGEAGATVYCTGRSVTGGPSPYGRPETIDETAAMIESAGGSAISVRVDHTVEAEVRALFERVDREQGRLDILADSVAGEDPLLGGWGSFWETDLEQGARALEQAVLSRVITAKHAAPHMIRERAGLIVEVTEGDLLFASGSILAQLARFAIKGFVGSMAEELRPHGVTAVSMTPGFLRSESMLEHFGVTEESWEEAGKRDADFLESESPLFVGRVVAALAADPDVLKRSGQLLSSWEIGREFGLEDYDGRRPDWGKHAEEKVIPRLGWLREGIERHVGWLEAISERGKRSLGMS